MTESQPTKQTSGRFLILLLLLGGALAVLCHDGFKHNYIFWSNDGPLGFLKCDSARLPGVFFGHWSCENYLGGEWPGASPNLDTLLNWAVSPEVFLKIFTPVSMLTLGLSFWLLFRQLKFGAPVCVLGGLAAGLNMHFFSVACWGLGTWCLAGATMALAMASIISPHIKQVWARGVLAGLAVGMCVMEGFDVGAILSIFVGVFAIFYFWVSEGNKGKAVAKIITAEAMMILFSVLFAASTIWGLYGTQIVGVAGPKGSSEEKWQFNTQWSTPPIETLGVFVSGLFGYRMQEYITDQDKSSAYWGLQGESPIIDQLESSDPKVRGAAGRKFGPQVETIMESDDMAQRDYVLSLLKNRGGVQLRHTGSGEYAGVAVGLLALLGLANSFRGEKSLLSVLERKMVWFFGAAAAVSLLSAWGRHSFLYGAIWYRMPGFSNIRNPMKFMHPFDILLIILAGYGLEALHRRYTAGVVGQARNFSQRWSQWWKNADAFEKGWFFGTIALVALAGWAFISYKGSELKLVTYLQNNGINADLAPQVAKFSITAALAGWCFLAVSVLAAILLWTGAWSRGGTLVGWGFLAAILIVDLGRADLPWIRYFDVGQKYSKNLLVDLLKDKPYDHRFAGRTSPTGGYDLSSDANLGGVCHWWMENDFPYNNIQNLEIDQAPRLPEMDARYLGRFGAGGGNLAGGARLWQLTNTRYMLCDAALVPTLNEIGDPVAHSFHAIGQYHMVLKPTATQCEDAGDLMLWPVDQPTDRPTVSTNTFALVQYDNALPRVKLYANWVTLDNDRALDTVASPQFPVDRAVVVSQDTPVPATAPAPTTADPGTVSITDYRSTDIKMQAAAKTPAVLLFNDRYLLPDDRVGKWTVTVDGKPEAILRCNYIMRGVFVTPGQHTIEFHYAAYLRYLYVTIVALLTGLAVSGYVFYTNRKTPVTPPQPDRA
ncbi:MAG TPA: hypothetical protein VHB20_05390 [Verrucomicrobiae bacterium]|jgi:hypothetical protein|nr:hypothetical protein [Verrucomicrobiae bacterium]